MLALEKKHGREGSHGKVSMKVQMELTPDAHPPQLF